MKPRIYVETTIVSYLTALPSRDLLVAAHQQVTRDWWSTRDDYELFVSQFVLDEAAAGDAAAAARRLEVLGDLPLLDITTEATALGRALLDHGAMPPKARIDALHVGVAAAHGMDYLVTWNCVHIANAARRGTIDEICRTASLDPPVICTPLELVHEEPT